MRTEDVGGPPKTGRNRLHIDLSPTDRDQNAEVGRLESFGAKRIDIGQETPSWIVMADPEGNEFCVLRRRVPPEPEPFGSFLRQTKGRQQVAVDSNLRNVGR